MAIAVDVVLVRLPLLNSNVMLVATLCERLVNVARPLEAVALSVPCRVPLPAPRATVIVVLLSAAPLAALRRLPNRSRTCTIGCWAKGTPAVAVAEGCVCRARLLAAPAVSRKRPNFEFAETPATMAVPVQARLASTNGVPDAGRTRRFCHVSLQVIPLALRLVTVKTSWVAVTEVMGT